MNYNSSINYDHDSLITVYNGVLINASVNVLSTLVYTSFCFNGAQGRAVIYFILWSTVQTF
jgi:hypothetical protein